MNTCRSARKEGYREKREGMCGELGNDPELGAEGREEVAWRSGIHVQDSTFKGPVVGECGLQDGRC